jgi:hypothetical protein
MCGHSAARPSSLQAAQARVTERVEKRGRLVVLSRILSRRVKKLISEVTVEIASRLVVPTMRRGNTVSYAKSVKVDLAKVKHTKKVIKLTWVNVGCFF